MVLFRIATKVRLQHADTVAVSPWPRRPHPAATRIHADSAPPPSSLILCFLSRRLSFRLHPVASVKPAQTIEAHCYNISQIL